jgi:uncharacterized protein YjeT (DUF2065 family)
VSDLLAALALVLILEGLAPLCFPQGWKEALRMLTEVDEGTLRLGGGVLVVVGLTALTLLRHG